MNYCKYHALGNDYIIIDPEKFKAQLTEENIRLLCHRNYGLGSDGILYGPLCNDKFNEGNSSCSKEFALKIYNPDGSEAEKSGNGIRIFSRYLLDAGYIKEKQFCVNTKGGLTDICMLDGIGKLIKVGMGKLSFISSDIKATGPVRDMTGEKLLAAGKELSVTCVSIGNPHCVVPLTFVSPELVREIGPVIENHEMFPERINVQLLKVIDRDNIQIEIWERGAGYTLASGSSSSAAAGAAYRLGLTGQKVMVHMPGGKIGIEIDDDWNVSMTGEVSGVAKGELMPDLIEQLCRAD